MEALGLIHTLLAQAATPPGGAAPEAPGPTKSLWQYVQGGGLIGYLIIGLSVVALALAIVQIIRLNKAKLAPPEVVSALSRYLSENDVAGALKFCNAAQEAPFIARVFGSALARCSRSQFGFLELRSSLEEAGAQEVTRLGRPTDGIALIGSIAPMLGLLGTVVGMVGAFDTIAGTQGTAKPSDLAGSISVALITTVQGLIVAIPCTALASYFRGRLERVASEASAVAESLASDLESANGSGAAKPASAPATQPPRAPRAVAKEARTAP
jgi:biopolymer transport protein ExbB